MDTKNPALNTTFGVGGQIVRVFLENFMSSDNVEVLPGMHLNLIIGPNGSGKSTLLSAVLLALGGKLSTLNRSSLTDFIKCGRDQSTIEIELYNPQGKNHTIRRVITKSNHSEFYLNDKHVRKNQIDDLRNHYNIQVDNLCCFLSQEKVQDFSKMDRQQLLENTEITVGDGELHQLHNELKQMREELIKHQQTIKKTDDDIVKETSLNERLRGKVEAIKEKQTLCDKVTTLNQKKHWLLYKESLKELEDIEKDLKAAELVVESHNKNLKVQQGKLRDIEEKSQTHRANLEVTKREESGKKSVLDDRLSRMQQQVDKFNALEAQHALKLQEVDDSKAVVRQHITNVEKLSNDLKAFESADNNSLANNQRITTELNSLRKNEDALSQRKSSLEEDVRNIKHELINVNRKRISLESVRERRLRGLDRTCPDVVKAAHWLDSNRHLFRGKVFKPLILELDVTDKNMVRQVEAVIPQNDLLAICVTFNDDLNLLVRKLRGELKLKVNIVSAEGALSRTFEPPEDIENLRPFGFMDYLKEYIAGPPEVIQYLCQNCNIHGIPVGNNRVNMNISKVPDTIQRFFSDTQQFTVRRSRYQNKAKSTTVVKLRAPVFFLEHMDHNQIAQLKKSEEQLAMKQEKNQSELKKLTESYDEITCKMSELRKLKRELVGLEEKKLDVQARLDRAKKELARHRAALKDPKTIQQEFLKEKMALEAKLSRMVDDVHKAHEAVGAAYFKRLCTSLLLKSSTIGIDVIREAEQQSKVALQKAEGTVNMVEVNRQRAERTRIKAKNIAKELTEGLTPDQKAFKEFKDKFDKLPDTVEAIESEMGDAQARADFLDGGSAEILAEYNKRERDIAALKDSLAQMRVKDSELLARINEKRQTWLDPVRELIERVDRTFSKHFETMKCAGEVNLSVPQDEYDFSEYGVSILVKFWDDMPLQELTRYTQSGGERTVATAIFGLSLQNLTSVPFRFVDEINQGMDARNERNICEMLSSSTSDVGSPQYFYLTPKLMDTFDCPDSMAVLCVYNGPTAVNTREWDVSKFIRRAEGEAASEDDDEGY